MNFCDRYERDLLLLLHGQLGPAKSLMVRGHILVCPACRERLMTFKRLSTRLADGLRRPNSVRPAGSFIPRTALAAPRLKGLLLLLIGASLCWLYTAATQASASASSPADTAVSGTHGDSCRIPAPIVKGPNLLKPPQH
jgi:anti-sigma factor RsiW